MTIRRVPVLVAILVSTSLGSQAAASEASARRHALELVKQGVSAYKKTHYADALQSFITAYRLYEAPPILLNLSRTELKLGDCDNALRYAQSYADGKDTDSTNQQRAAWQQQVETECVQILISAAPPQALIQIDGVTPLPVTTPWRGRLLAGRHPVTVSAPGYVDHRAILVVLAGRPGRFDIVLNVRPSLVAPIVAPPPGTPGAAAPAAAAPDLDLDMVFQAPDQQPTKVPPSVPVTAEKRAKRLYAAMWVFLSTGAAAAAVAGTLGGLELRCTTGVLPPIEAGRSASCQKFYATGADISWGAAAVSGVTGLALLTGWATNRPTSGIEQVAVGLGPAGVALSASF